MKTFTHISFILFCFVFASCEQEIAIGEIDVEKYVVVNSTFCPQKEFIINLAYSKSALDAPSETEWIDDADVRVYRGDGEYLFTASYIGDGNYLGNTNPTKDQIYTLEVKVSGYSLITASSRVPRKAIIENLVATHIEQDGEEAFKVDFDIVDAEDIDNYYIWEIVQVESTTSNPNAQLVEYDGIQTIGPSESFQDNGTWSKLFLQEMDIDAGISFISFYNNQEVGEPNPDQPVQELDASLKVISASFDYFRYLRSLEIFRNNKGVNGSSSSIIPVELHSNVNGGFGIFAGFNEETQDIHF